MGGPVNRSRFGDKRKELDIATSNIAGQALQEFKESGPTDKIFVVMLVFVPVAFIVNLLGLPPLLVFVISALAVIPLAKSMSNATEALAHHAGPAIGGLLNATFGNAVELIIAILALFEGLTEVVKASIAGSIIGNILLVMGMSMFFGGLSREQQYFNKVGASASASQLFLAAIALVIPAVFTSTIGNERTPQAKDDLLESLSLLVAGILIVCYIGQLIFFLFTHRHLSTEGAHSATRQKTLTQPTSWEESQRELAAEERADDAEDVQWSVPRAMLTLFVATVVVGIVSEILVGSIEPVTKQLGWTELFVGVILVAIVGNAAEYVSAISSAVKNRMNLSINIAIGASLQLAFFVVPVLVFLGLFVGHRLTLRFEEFELVCIIVAVLIVNRVAEDGESNWFEGLQLIGAYLIIAVAFFLHP